jgi:indole-3-glycerol phosphate synthase
VASIRSERAAPAAPIAAERLVAIPGVLGRIARERADAYARTPVPALPAATAAPGDFVRALTGPGLALIAEVKRASPSQGAIADLDPVAAARAYVAGGARAVSVLTEPRHFGGDLAHLSAVSAAALAPTLRKDFVVHPAQVHEARAAGAAAVLLMVAVLGDALASYLALAQACGLDALVEVHDEAELEVAVASGARLVGVNNRDLTTLAIDLATAPRVIARGRAMGHEACWVAESGYGTRSDLATVRSLADAVLIGTSLARQGDLTAAVRTLLDGA